MREKKWFGQYGVHIVICSAVIISAFLFNQKVNLDRSHVYSVSNGVYSILKMITKAEVNGNQLELQGWAFDTEIYNESSNCELILQDTETGEPLWVKMDKNPEVVEIAERYTDGEDYSGACFGGSIKASQLNKESVYEILIRYTTDYVDENGNEQQYVRTVSTDEFVYQGQMTEYNPKTFTAPEIAGTELEKELEGARLFHWFEEGMWVYYTEENVYYILEKELASKSEPFIFPLNWEVRDVTDLPEVNQQYGFGNRTFQMYENKVRYEGVEGYEVWCSEKIPKMAVYVSTGIYSTEKKKTLLGVNHQIGVDSYE